MAEKKSKTAKAIQYFMDETEQKVWDIKRKVKALEKRVTCLTDHKKHDFCFKNTLGTVETRWECSRCGDERILDIRKLPRKQWKALKALGLTTGFQRSMRRTK